MEGLWNNSRVTARTPLFSHRLVDLSPILSQEYRSGRLEQALNLIAVLAHLLWGEHALSAGTFESKRRYSTSPRYAIFAAGTGGNATPMS